MARDAPRLLVVEDNQSDVRLLEEALRMVEAPWELDVVESVAAAVKYIRKQESPRAKRRPDWAVLDIQLRDGHGIQVLDLIRSSNALRHLPCTMFTTSQRAVDVQDALEGGATEYVVKPLEMDGMLEFAQSLAARHKIE